MIKHTLEYILKHKTEFKMCSPCNAVNMSKNDHCHECQDNDFRIVDDEDDYELEERYLDDEEIETAHNLNDKF